MNILLLLIIIHQLKDASIRLAQFVQVDLDSIGTRCVPSFICRRNVFGKVCIQIKVTDSLVVRVVEYRRWGVLVLIVDTTIAHPVEFTFFMIDHHSINVRHMPDQRNDLSTKSVQCRYVCGDARFATAEFDRTHRYEEINRCPVAFQWHPSVSLISGCCRRR